MPTLNQRHKDRLATLDNAFSSGAAAGVPTGYVCFGFTDGSITGSSDLVYDSAGNILTTTGTISTNALTAVSATITGLTVTSNATINGSASIGGSLTVSGNEILQGTLTTGSNSIATTNVLGYVNVTALIPGPVGTWLTTGNDGIVNWNAIPDIAAGWTFDGTKIYSNAGIPVRVNSLSTGAEKFNVGGTSIFQSTVNITNGGLTLVGPLSVANGTGSAGQALFSNGTGSAYWSTFGGLTATVNVDNAGGTQRRIPYATGYHILDASNDLIIDTTAAGRNQFRINTSSSGPLGNQKLQVLDDQDGLGCAYFETTSSTGVEVICIGTSYAGVASAALGASPDNVAKLFQMSCNTVGGPFCYFVCAQPATEGGGRVIKAFMNTGGSLILAGSLTAASKSFSIPHPLPILTASKNLVHMSVESSKSDLIYRGKANLLKGKAKVNLDLANGMTNGTLSYLTDLKNGEVWIQNKTSFSQCKGSISGNILTITCEDKASTDAVSWLVMLERTDSTIRESDLCDDDGHLICEQNKGIVS